MVCARYCLSASSLYSPQTLREVPCFPIAQVRKLRHPEPVNLSPRRGLTDSPAPGLWLSASPRSGPAVVGTRGRAEEVFWQGRWPCACSPTSDSPVGPRGSGDIGPRGGSEGSPGRSCLKPAPLGLGWFLRRGCCRSGCLGVLRAQGLPPAIAASYGSVSAAPGEGTSGLWCGRRRSLCCWHQPGVCPAHTLCLGTPLLAEAAVLRREGGGRAGLRGAWVQPGTLPQGPPPRGARSGWEKKVPDLHPEKMAELEKCPPKEHFCPVEVAPFSLGSTFALPLGLEDTSWGGVCAGSRPWLPLISAPTPCCHHHLPE